MGGVDTTCYDSDCGWGLVNDHIMMTSFVYCVTIVPMYCLCVCVSQQRPSLQFPYL